MSETLPVNYFFTVRHIPENYLIIVSIVFKGRILTHPWTVDSAGSEVCSSGAQHGEAIVDVSRRFIPVIFDGQVY